MPWNRRSRIGCCLFCKSEYYIRTFGRGRVEFHKCPQSAVYQKSVKNAKNRAYWKKKLAERGLEVRHRQPSTRKIKLAEKLAKEERTGVYIKARNYKCKCGNWTVNRFNCSACLSRIGDVFDLSIAVEPGYTRHIGSFVGE